MNTTRPQAAAQEAPKGREDELRDDLFHLLARVESQQCRLGGFEQALRANTGSVRPVGVDTVRPILEHLRAQYDALFKDLRSALDRVATASPEATCRAKRDAIERCRSLQGLAAALLASINWQAPSCSHSHWSQAGTLTGKIVITKNDYMRDHHAFGDAYEHAYSAAFVDTPLRQPVRAYATSSGMAAFAMAATRLCSDGGDVIVGAGTWFQNKMLLNRLFAGRVHYVDEHDTGGIVEVVRRYRPTAVFLDTLCNAVTLAMPDLASLLPAIDEAADRPTAVVLDNTCLSATYQPLRHMPWPAKHLRLLVFESLNKYQQFGADRVTGGILWTPHEEFEDLFFVRMLVGGNIPDATVHALPPPDRALLDGRMRRIGRNACRLAQRLQAHVRANPEGAFERVVHPSLPGHPAQERAMRLPFQGGCVNLVPRRAYRLLDAYQRFLSLAVEEARNARVELNIGSSFGFDTTRLYLTTPFATQYTQPFLRISAGTECLRELERLGDALVRAMRQMDALPPSEFVSDMASAATMQWSSLRKSHLGKWATNAVLR